MQARRFRLWRLAYGLAADALAGLVKITAYTVGAACALLVALTVVLWNEDPYALRDRFEHWRTAWSEEWKPIEKRETKVLADGGKHGVR